MKRALVLSLAALAIFPARAADTLDLFLRSGQDGDKIHSLGLSLRGKPWWSKDWGAWRGTLRPEGELAYLRYDGSGGDGPKNMGLAGATAGFRIMRHEGNFRPYGELGLGGALFSETRLGPKDFSTHFQFTEYIGLGVEFGRGWFAGWRYSHYSNASIKKPNDGLDMQQLVIGVTF